MNIIRHRREQLGISQTKLARLLGFTQPKMHMLETFKERLTVQTAIRVAEILDMDVGELCKQYDKDFKNLKGETRDDKDKD